MTRLVRILCVVLLSLGMAISGGDRLAWAHPVAASMAPAANTVPGHRSGPALPIPIHSEQVVGIPAEVRQALASSAAVTTLTVTTTAGTRTIMRSAVSSSPMSPATAGAYSYSFTRSQPSYTGADSNGVITGRVTYTGSWPLAWSYIILADPYDYYATSLVTEVADCYANGVRVGDYHDSHVEPIDYTFHSTVPRNNGHVPYLLWATFVWKFSMPGVSGTARVDAYFSYTVS